jgi:hypothetical protein
MNPKDRLATLRDAFVLEPGQEPQRVYISREDENDLAGMSRDAWGGDLAMDVLRFGIRRALPALFGLPITWDAPETHFE